MHYRVAGAHSYAPPDVVGVLARRIALEVSRTYPAQHRGVSPICGDIDQSGQWTDIGRVQREGPIEIALGPHESIGVSHGQTIVQHEEAEEELRIGSVWCGSCRAFQIREGLLRVAVPRVAPPS